MNRPVPLLGFHGAETPASPSLAVQRRLIEALKESGAFEHPVHDATIIETHISFVLLTGRYAYKIKKAVDFGFLDFTTLAARRFYCEEELRLNRRLAPKLYLEVVPITGTVERPSMNGSGPALEYAVRMREFDQADLLSRLLERGALTRSDIDSVAKEVASFHERADRAAATTSFGTPEAVWEDADQNFRQISAIVTSDPDRSDLDALWAWTRQEHARCRTLLSRRKNGFVRECHGDLHLNNIAMVEKEVTLFDCIEFNESMRWIDVMSDVAFLVMDLQERGRSDLAARFLNGYLEITGDYEGLMLLPFYVTYRAMVRAKIASLRMSQGSSDESRSASWHDYRQYIQLAQAHGRPRPAIIVMHGLSGSGKTTISGDFVERVGAVRLRSDVERKRLHGLEAAARTASPIAQGIYAEAETRRVYQRLSELARTVAAAGYMAIVDATFLKRWERDLLRNTAEALGVPFVIVDCSMPVGTLRQRVERRVAGGGDASEATLSVVEAQLAEREPLADEEQPFVVRPDDLMSSSF